MRDFGDLIPAYVEESLEHLKKIKENISIIKGGSSDIKMINRVFSGLHSIKGGASFLNLKHIEKLSHVMEEVLNMVKNNELEFTSKLSSCLLKGADKLKEMLDASEKNDNYNINGYLKELKNCLENKPMDKVVEKIKVDIQGSHVQVDKKNLDLLRKQGKKVYLIQFELKEESLGGRNLLDLFNEVEKVGEIIVRNVDMELVLRKYNFTGEGLPLSILYASVLERDYVAIIFGIKEEIVKEVKPNSLLEEEIVGDALIKNREKKIGYVPGINMDWDSYLQEDGEEQEKIPAGQYETESPRKMENQFLTFFIKDEAYGIAAEQIDKIVPLEEIAPLPYLPYEKDSIKGILNLQGEILPVYDFRAKMKLAESAYDKETLILIVMFRDDDNCDKKIGVIVDSVSGIIPMKPEEITKIHRVKRIPSKYIAGIGKTQGKSITLLELKEIFS